MNIAALAKKASDSKKAPEGNNDDSGQMGYTEIKFSDGKIIRAPMVSVVAMQQELVDLIADRVISALAAFATEEVKQPAKAPVKKAKRAIQSNAAVQD